MNEKKSDRRVQKTRDALRNALVKRLEKKRLNDITVKELCTDANINRGTFYLHYNNVYDLFEKIENEMYDEISAFIEKNSKTGTVGDVSDMLPTFLSLFKYLEQNLDVCGTLLSQTFSRGFIRKMLMISYEDCVNYWVNFYKLEDRAIAEMVYHFIVSGCVGLIQYRLENENSAEKLAALAEQVITRGIGMLGEFEKRAMRG